MKIAWFGHVASARADGIVTYSREMINGLRRRGQNGLPVRHVGRAVRFDQDELKAWTRGQRQGDGQRRVFHRSV